MDLIDRRVCVCEWVCLRVNVCVAGSSLQIRGGEWQRGREDDRAHDVRGLVMSIQLRLWPENVPGVPRIYTYIHLDIYTYEYICI